MVTTLVNYASMHYRLGSISVKSEAKDVKQASSLINFPSVRLINLNAIIDDLFSGRLMWKIGENSSESITLF